MSCFKLGNLVHRTPPTSGARPALKKKGYRDSEPPQLEKLPIFAPGGRMATKPEPRPRGRRFDAGPTPPAPGDVPTPMPPTSAPPAPGGIPDIGADAPDTINYPNTSTTPNADAVDTVEGGRDGGSWCCCCPA